MSTIAQELQALHAELPPGVSLCAVSKFHPVEALREAYNAGQRIFGESRVQELREKQAAMPADVEWHFIGHLQPNKVKYIAPFVSLIHAVDTPKLLAEISRQGAKVGRQIPCLLQVHVAQEESKFGFAPDELRSYMAEGTWREHPNALISGLMCMATFTDDEAQIAREFATAAALFSELRAAHFADAPHFAVRSWGMSDDYPLAIASGSNIVRIGTRIFGQRQY